jgi:hypothetical protein
MHNEQKTLEELLLICIAKNQHKKSIKPKNRWEDNWLVKKLHEMGSKRFVRKNKL